MDPGYFPDPIKLENNLIRKNLEFNEKMKYATIDSFYATADESTLQCEEDKIITQTKKRYKFIKDFGKCVNEGPLTSSEFFRYRNNLEKFVLPPNDRGKCSLDVSQNNLIEEKLNLNFEDVFENFRNTDFNKVILCQHCFRWKVERSHHCRQCGKCVLKMDHHCPWVANCIGFRNYKYFCLLILYAFLSSLLVFCTFWEAVMLNNLNDDSSVLLCSLYTFIYIMNFGLLCFLTHLLNVNCSLVFNNQTVIEKSDLERFPDCKPHTQPYYQGLYKNFTLVFGNNPLFWFLPINANYEGGGIIFESI